MSNTLNTSSSSDAAAPPQQVLEPSPSLGEASSQSTTTTSTTQQPAATEPIVNPSVVATTATAPATPAVEPQNPFESPIQVVRSGTDSSSTSHQTAEHQQQQQQQPDTLMSAMSVGEGSLATVTSATTPIPSQSQQQHQPPQPVSPDRSEAAASSSTGGGVSLTAPSSPAGAARNMVGVGGAAVIPTGAQSAPSTPVPPHHSSSLRPAPQSAPVVSSSSSNSQQPLPQRQSGVASEQQQRQQRSSATTNLTPTSSPIVAMDRLFLQQQIPSSPQHSQPIFDDDETTEPSSAGNTADMRVMHGYRPENIDDDASYDDPNNPAAGSSSNNNNTFSRWVEFTRRKLNAAAAQSGSDDDDDDLAGTTADTIIAGYLQKLGRNGKWQTRWFETDGECLSYYKSHKRTKLLATLDLEKVGAIGVDEGDPKECAFNIQVLGRLYNLRADSRAACKDWVITLNRVKEARMQQGNVKLVDPAHHHHHHPVVDLLDAADAEPQDSSSVTPRVVVVANRQRTRAVDESMEFERMLMLKGSNSPPGEQVEATVGTQPLHESRRSTLGTVVLARWSKRRSSLQRLSAKLAKWARSVRRYSCTHGDTGAVQLDLHVHPPGHDDARAGSKGKAHSLSRVQEGSVVVVPQQQQQPTQQQPPSNNPAAENPNAAWIEREKATQQSAAAGVPPGVVASSTATTSTASSLRPVAAQLHRGMSDGSEDGARYLS